MQRRIITLDQNTRNTGKLWVSTQIRKCSGGRMTISAAVVSVLDYPKNCRFLYNREKQLLAIQVCEKMEPGAKSVSIRRDNYNRIEISCFNLIKMIYQECGWNEHVDYRLYGKHVPSHKLVEFALSEAEPISIDEKAIHSVDS